MHGKDGGKMMPPSPCGYGTAEFEVVGTWPKPKRLYHTGSGDWHDCPACRWWMADERANQERLDREAAYLEDVEDD